MEKIAEKKLIERIKNGDMTAFKELIDHNERSVSAIIISYLGKTEEAENIAQDVFVNFFFNIHKFKGHSAVKTYLIRIAINLSINELKRQKRIKERESRLEKINNENEIENEAFSPEIYEKREVIELALNKLETLQRTVVVLRLIEGYSTKETAKLLKIPEGTVLSRLYRGQEKLKKLLKYYLDR